MSISAYQASVPLFTQMLQSLSKILDKAAAEKNGNDLLEKRLAPDMYQLTRQVQLASDHAKGAAARLSGTPVPSYEDTEASYKDLKQRISKTLDFIGGIDPKAFDGAEDRQISLKIGGTERSFPGRQYLLHFSLPNFFFHVTTAYDILRHNGVKLGKTDFVGQPPSA